MESAERNGSAWRRLLRSAERFNEAAIRLGSLEVNTPPSRVSASLCSVTARDQRRRGLAVVVRRDAPGLLRRLVDLRAAPPRRLDAAAFLAMIDAPVR
jgi:hypothetical protein